MEDKAECPRVPSKSCSMVGSSLACPCSRTAFASQRPIPVPSGMGAQTGGGAGSGLDQPPPPPLWHPFPRTGPDHSIRDSDPLLVVISAFPDGTGHFLPTRNQRLAQPARGWRQGGGRQGSPEHTQMPSCRNGEGSVVTIPHHGKVGEGRRRLPAGFKPGLESRPQ